jgi:2-polyprenyl-3-methyl-5-hydroxy-6-metoxy-1,4-benzoquinol methylase
MYKRLCHILWEGISIDRRGGISGRMRNVDEYFWWNYVEQHLGDLTGKTLVDFGCGYGVNSLVLALAGAKVIGYDNDETRVGFANYNLQQLRQGGKIVDAQFHVGDLNEKLNDIEDASVDYAFCQQVIEHIKNYEVILNEMARILKPGGKVYLSTPNAVVMRPGEGERVYGEKEHSHFFCFTAAFLKRKFNGRGMYVEDISYMPPKSIAIVIKLIDFIRRKETRLRNALALLRRKTGDFLRLPSTMMRVYILLSEPFIKIYNKLVFPFLLRVMTDNFVKNFKNENEGQNIYLIATK